MKVFISILLTVAFLSLNPTFALTAQKVQPSLTVRFADGVEIKVADWIFEYEFGSSNEPPTGLFYTPSYYKTNDFMLAISKTERGVTFTDEKRISPSQLKSIKFEYEYEISLKKITIQFSDGQILEVDKPILPKKLLSKENYVFQEKLYLKGSAVINNRRGTFSKQLYPMFDEKDVKERIVEIDFDKK